MTVFFYDIPWNFPVGECHGLSGKRDKEKMGLELSTISPPPPYPSVFFLSPGCPTSAGCPVDSPPTPPPSPYNHMVALITGRSVQIGTHNDTMNQSLVVFYDC